jgi:hypothetical protein
METFIGFKLLDRIPIIGGSIKRTEQIVNSIAVYTIMVISIVVIFFYFIITYKNNDQ